MCLGRDLLVDEVGSTAFGGAPCGPVGRDAQGNIWQTELRREFGFAWHGHANHLATEPLDGVDFGRGFELWTLGEPIRDDQALR